MRAFQIGDVVRVRPEFLAEERGESWWRERGVGVVQCLVGSYIKVVFGEGEHIRIWSYHANELVNAKESVISTSSLDYIEDEKLSSEDKKIIEEYLCQKV